LTFRVLEIHYISLYVGISHEICSRKNEKAAFILEWFFWNCQTKRTLHFHMSSFSQNLQLLFYKKKIIFEDLKTIEVINNNLTITTGLNRTQIKFLLTPVSINIHFLGSLGWSLWTYTVKHKNKNIRMLGKKWKLRQVDTILDAVQIMSKWFPGKKML